MILKRIGIKSRSAKDIIRHFPKHNNFIELFFGAGGIYFNKPLAKNNFVNDIDNDVYNLFNVVRFRKDELVSAIALMPLHESLFTEWKTKVETDPIWKAARFLMLSNFSYMGKCDTLHFRTNSKPKQVILDNIDLTFEKITNTHFMCCDFRDVLPKIAFESGKDKIRDLQNTFVYADPPYWGQTHTYQQGFTKSDTSDLFEVMVNSKVNFAISEFDNPHILALAEHHGLEVITIGERQNLKNKRTEILVVNYKSDALYSLFNTPSV